MRSQVKETYYSGVSDDADQGSSYHSAEKEVVPSTTGHGKSSAQIFSQSVSSTQEIAAEQILKGWKSKTIIRLLV